MLKSLAAALLIICFLLTGCAPDTPDSLGKEALDIMEDFVEVLEGVDDVESARAAKPAIQDIADRLEDNFSRRRALGDPTPEEQDAFEANHGTRAESISERMDAEVTRIAALGPEVNAELEAGMQALLEMDVDGEP